jgi:hypothetical protein
MNGALFLLGAVAGLIIVGGLFFFAVDGVMRLISRLLR